MKDFSGEFTTSEWTILELTRALVKAGHSKKEINESVEIIEEFISLGVLKTIPVSHTIDLAKSLQIEFSLYASDAVHIASAINCNSTKLWSEDQHHHKKKIKEYLKKFNMEVKKL